jgi:hypothetical protein
LKLLIEDSLKAEHRTRRYPAAENYNLRHPRSHM